MAQLTGGEVALIYLKRDMETGLHVSSYITPNGELEPHFNPIITSLTGVPPKVMVDTESQTDLKLSPNKQFPVVALSPVIIDKKKKNKRTKLN